MSDRTASTSSGLARNVNPGHITEKTTLDKKKNTIPADADWKIGTEQSKNEESEAAVSVHSESDSAGEFSGFSETSSSSDRSDYQAADSAATKMSQLPAQDAPDERNATTSHQHPSKFCLTGVGTSLGFSAAVAGFAATIFLYDLMTKFPNKATSEIGVAFGASVVIALGGTITCSTSMVFMIRELCKAQSG